MFNITGGSYESSTQKLKRESRNYLFRNVLAIGLFLGGLAALQAIETTPDEAFDTAYTAPGQCLQGTQFDKKLGAVSVNREIRGKATISVIPQGANTSTPAVLDFFVDRSGFLNRNSELRPRDNETVDYLMQRCGTAMSN